MEETKELFENGYEIQDIAQERQLTPSTIINHLGKLQKEGLDISVAHPGDEVVEQVRKIYKNFSEQNVQKTLTMMVQFVYDLLLRRRSHEWDMTKFVLHYFLLNKPRHIRVVK